MENQSDEAYFNLDKKAKIILSAVKNKKVYTIKLDLFLLQLFHLVLLLISLI